MGDLEGCSPFDASTQTRILTPYSGSLLSSHEPSVVASKKRKRERSAMEDLLDDSFVVKPHPSTVFCKPHSLTPLALISRMHVPLSYLDILSPSGLLPASRFFQAHVKILELEERMGNTPMVLIARLDDGKSLFVVERVEQNLYVLCKLSSCVKLGQLCAKAVVSRHQALQKATQEPEAGSGLPENDGESQVTSESSKYSKKKRLAIEAIQSMVKRPSKELLSTTQDAASLRPQSAAVVETQSQGQKAEMETIQEGIFMRPMAAEIFDNIRSQYYEALYLSKASLAYFAKGPLSRARAAFHLDYDSTLDMNDLVAFLESLVLPANLVDKKYKDGVPNILLRFIILDGSAEEAVKTPTKSRKPKSKKMRPGKNGLYPSEEAYICRWWDSCESDASIDGPGESKEEIMRRRITQLRIRETQLQMIVALEILALRPLATSLADRFGELPSIGQTDAMTDGKTLKRFKSKKPLDLAVLIEVHVDRLCIWQSLAAEEGRIASAVGEGSDTPSRPKVSASSQDHAADTLREFCVGVVVPFFSARLPEQCGTISRKLGGPVVASPVRPILKISATSTTAPRPGGITKRRTVTKTRKSLRRVLTDERHAREGSRGTSGAILLMRSATAPTIPGLKREGSETPLLSSIPSIADTQAISRGGVLKSKKFSQREVDLGSLSTVNDAKLKKVNIEAELKDAISALKRPNRQLAGQLQVETAEKRAASASLHSRKSKKPIRNPSIQGVQILSTPKGNRQKDARGFSHPIQELTSGQDHELEVIPPSSIPRIPLSVTREANDREPERKSLCKATPARSRPGTHIGTAAQNYGGPPPCSPLQAKNSSKQQVLEIPMPYAKGIECTPTKMDMVHATPCKQRKTNIFPQSTPMGSLNIELEAAGMEETESTGISGVPRGRARNDDSIYKSLGWDDYDDIA